MSVRLYAPNVDLVNSPDDNGWYLQRYPDQATSQLFTTDLAACQAYDRGQVEWEGGSSNERRT